MEQDYSPIEHPKGSKIKIRLIDNITQGVRRGVSFQVTVPSRVSGQGRIRKQFTTEKEAKDFAEQQHKGVRQEGEAYFQLSPQERREIGIVVPKLRKKEVSITYAIQFALDRIPDTAGYQTLGEVVKELANSKRERHERGKLGYHTLRTFEYQTNRLVDKLGADTLIHEITQEQIEEYIKGIEGGDRTRKNYFRAANEVLEHAKGRGYILVEMT